jgi:hypothetical protein
MVFAFFSLLSSTSRIERNAKLATVLGGGVFMLAGAIQYVVGLVKYTAAYFFPSELANDRMELMFVSLLFHGKYATTMVCLGSVGAGIAIICGRAKAKLFGTAMLACIFGIISFGYISTQIDFWRGPSPLYFEFLLWPFYAVFATALFFFVLSVFSASFARWSFYRQASMEVQKWNGYGYVTVAITPWLLVIGLQTFDSPTVRPRIYPPPESPIVEILKRDIAIKPGGEFRGRVATFTGMRQIEKQISWMNLHEVDGQIIGKIGNDHRMVGLWYYNIPTLMEYSPFLSPAFYVFTKTFFALSGDHQMRSVMALRRPHPRLLAAIGVRFVVTDSTMTDGTNRATVSLGDMGNLYLYELARPNLGQYSPNIAVVSTNVKEILSILGAQDFDPQRKFVVSTSLPGNLVAATQSRILVDEGYLEIVASSKGTSVILLPIEFSRCLSLRVEESVGESPRLFRANLVQTGILFDKKLNAKVSYFTGPFQNSHCRLEDANDFRELISH